MGHYLVLSEDGLDRLSHPTLLGRTTEVGDEIELDLTADQERAVVAAGWLEKLTKKKEKEG